MFNGKSQQTQTDNSDIYGHAALSDYADAQLAEAAQQARERGWPKLDATTKAAIDAIAAGPDGPKGSSLQAGMQMHSELALQGIDADLASVLSYTESRMR